jgi:glycosyltransferase involved in cell wall biosynthesis
MGKPILTTNVGDASDLIRKYNCGVVVTSNNPHNLLEGMKLLKYKGEEQLVLMGNLSRKLAEERFSWRVIGRELAEALKGI